jgi:hypothetical protein
MTHLDDETIYALAVAGATHSDTESEAHLRTCDSCRARWEGAVALRRAVGAAPRAVDPPGNLWPSIRLSIEARRPMPAAHRRGWGLAAAILIATAAALVVVPRGGRAPDVRAIPMPALPAVRAVTDSAAAADDARVERELLSELELRRGELRPETAARVQDNLRTIDAAIADVRTELARDPDNPALRQMLVEAYAHKTDLVALLANAA